MNNEKQSNWKQHLEELDSLPDETEFDKHTAWEQLHKRLHNKPRHSKTVWYWAAAAVLLLIGLPLLVKKTGTTPPANNLVRVKPLPVAPAITPGTQKEQAVTIASTPVIKRKIDQPPVKHPRKKIIPAPGPIIETGLITPAIESPTSTVNNISVAKDVVLAAAPPVKKKVAVVHINELEMPPAQLAALPVQQQKAFHLKITNRLPNNQLAVSRQGQQDIFNVKISLKTN